jgi:hemoglobin-like flavoprotein
MTPEQLALVRSSYAVLGADAPAMAEDFYRRLFTAEPSTRALFTDGPDIMSVKFAAELDAIVQAIASFDDFRPRVGALGARHAAYGVRTEHYRAVGDALVGALAAHLAEIWDPALEAAWRRAYNLVAEMMMDAQQAATRDSGAVPGSGHDGPADEPAGR